MQRNGFFYCAERLYVFTRWIIASVMPKRLLENIAPEKAKRSSASILKPYFFNAIHRHIYSLDSNILVCHPYDSLFESDAV
jgi:hypothetical protein